MIQVTLVKAGFPRGRELWARDPRGFEAGFEAGIASFAPSFAAVSQRPSIRFDGSGFPGDLDHRRLPEGAMGPPRGLPWDRDPSEPSRDKLTAEVIACFALLESARCSISHAPGHQARTALA